MQKISENGTLAQMLIQYQQIALQLAQQVNPALAEQLAQQILSQGGQTIPTTMGVADTSLEAEQEHPYVERARNEARESTQAD